MWYDLICIHYWKYSPPPPLSELTHPSPFWLLLKTFSFVSFSEAFQTTECFHFVYLVFIAFLFLLNYLWQKKRLYSFFTSSFCHFRKLLSIGTFWLHNSSSRPQTLFIRYITFYIWTLSIFLHHPTPVIPFDYYLIIYLGLGNILKVVADKIIPWWEILNILSSHKAADILITLK